jgi:D-lactate dehydrogenase (cytochrome)
VQASVAAGQRIAIVGGGTKSRGSGKADVVLSTTQLSGIRSCSVDDLVVTAGAGTRLADLQAELAREGMWTPLVSPWGAATIGGIVAANFNAPLRMRYGNVRDIMLAGTVVLPDGRTIRAGRPVVKNVAGYDLPKLFVGSYGTLGLLTDVSLKLAPLPRARGSLIVPVDSVSQGMRWGRELLRVCLVASALVMCSGDCVPRESAPYALIYTAEGMPEDVAAEMAQAEAVLRAAGAHPSRQSDAPSGSELWAEWLGAAGPELIVRAGVAPKDMARLVAAVAPSAPNAAFFADIASGQLFTRGVPVETARAAALALGGYAVVVRGEAGESDPWGYRPQSLDLMLALKRRLDPAGLFNPGAFIV